MSSILSENTTNTPTLQSGSHRYLVLFVFYPDANISSAILPRLDPWKLGDLDRVNSINSELKRSVNNSYLKNLKFVDFSEHFISNWKIRKECYRFFYERQLDEPDLCHFSDDGNVRLNGEHHFKRSRLKLY
jgi:hypothetical protein